MRKQMIQSAAHEVATQIRAVEDTIDGALAEIAELQARVMHARSLAGVSVGVAQPAIERLAETLQSLVTARGAMANCHAALVEAKGEVPGLRTVGFGDVEPDCQTAVQPIRIVA